MNSIVWDGAQPVNQPWGCTALTVEPWWVLPDCHWHCGIDIGDPYCLGKPLRAARAGVVAQLWPGILGIAVAGGETDYYVHGTYQVGLGAEVLRGQRIGSFGNIAPSGGSTTGPHLHFERQRPGGHINVPATSLDPVPVLTASTFGGSAAELKPTNAPRRVITMATAASGLHQFCRGRADANTGHRQLYHRRRLAGTWTAWAAIGGDGNVGVDDLGAENIAAGLDDQGVIVVTVTGSDGASFFETTSSDNGTTWTPWAGPSGAGDGLAALSVAAPAPVVSAVSVDLGPVLAAVDGVKGVVDAINAREAKDLA